VVLNKGHEALGTEVEEELAIGVFLLLSAARRERTLVCSRERGKRERAMERRESGTMVERWEEGWRRKIKAEVGSERKKGRAKGKVGREGKDEKKRTACTSSG
jgi:hypothetical protein